MPVVSAQRAVHRPPSPCVPSARAARACRDPGHSADAAVGEARRAAPCERRRTSPRPRAARPSPPTAAPRARRRRCCAKRASRARAGGRTADARRTERGHRRSLGDSCDGSARAATARRRPARFAAGGTCWSCVLASWNRSGPKWPNTIARIGSCDDATGRKQWPRANPCNIDESLPALDCRCALCRAGRGATTPGANASSLRDRGTSAIRLLGRRMGSKRRVGQARGREPHHPHPQWLRAARRVEGQRQRDRVESQHL